MGSNGKGTSGRWHARLTANSVLNGCMKDVTIKDEEDICLGQAEPVQPG
jgi:hypothetical protein